MIALQERTDIRPVCPHCDHEVELLYYQGIRSAFGKRFIYLCPDCHKILGVTHRKGFWMG